MGLCRRAIVCLVSLVSAAAVACSSPPDREMNQAQGAIRAAQAAGADQYATDEYRAAVQALERAHAAVEQRDYRLALSSALDAQERAQEAARQAAAGRAEARGDVERSLADVEAALKAAEARLAGAESVRVPSRQLTDPRGTLTGATKAVQEARAAVGREDYAGAKALLDGLQTRIQEAATEIDAAIESQPPKRRGR
jgi:colicin import membrane protein